MLRSLSKKIEIYKFLYENFSSFPLLLQPLFAYELGSSVDEKILTTLKINDNKIYIVDFFASWCHSCEKEIPDLNKLHKNLDKTSYELT